MNILELIEENWCGDVWNLVRFVSAYRRNLNSSEKNIKTTYLISVVEQCVLPWFV
jgi:hypothetical protein